MKKLNLLMFDANVIIYLFEINLWDRVVEKCDIHIARTVVAEADVFYDEADLCHPIDLTSFEQNGRITVFDVEVSQVIAFLDKFDQLYVDDLDPGETESLVYLLDSSDEFRICTADAIVFKILGNLKKSELGISLEEVLQQIGFGRKLSWQWRASFRKDWTRRGFLNGMHGFGMMNSDH